MRKYVVETSVGPDQVIRMELVMNGCLFQHVHLGKDYSVVVLKSVLRILLSLEERSLQFFFSDLLDEREIPHVFEVVHFLQNEDCVVRFSSQPNELFELFGSEDYDIGLCLQQLLEVGKVELKRTLETIFEFASSDVVKCGDVRENRSVPFAGKDDK